MPTTIGTTYVDQFIYRVPILTPNSTRLRKSVRQRRKKGNTRMIRASGDIKLLLHLLRVNDAILNVVCDLVQYDLGYGLLMRLTVHDL